jgi:hypothetical protein
MTKELKEEILKNLPNANLQLDGLHDNCNEEFTSNVVINYFKRLFPKQVVNYVKLNNVNYDIFLKYPLIQSRTGITPTSKWDAMYTFEYKSGIVITTNDWGIGNEVKIYYIENKSKFILELIETCFDNLIKDGVNNINLLRTTKNGLTTVSLKLQRPILNIETHYSKEFKPIYDTIISSVNEDKSNGKLILLHREAGTGKSNLIKYMVSDFNKPVIFIPPNLINCITNPDFTDFLINNNNSILILEDAEKVLTDRNISQDSSGGVSNLLNLTDGIYGDLLNIYVIATFNMERERIDPALLRKGRLIAEHKFSKLNVEQSNNLLKELDLDYITEAPMTLADIYNIEYQQPKVKLNTKKIGF